MPSPLAHGLAGLTVHALACRRAEDLWNLPRAAAVVGAALAPDLDLLLRWVDGRNHHQAESHSLGLALLAAAVVGVLGRWRRLDRVGILSLAVGAAWLSHVFLDYLSRDTHPPIGLLALWPFSHDYFKFPWPIFLDIGRTLDVPTIRHNLVACAWEAVLLGPLVVVAWRRRFLEKE